MPGKLYLIPASIGSTPPNEVIPDYVLQKINSISVYIVENERTARRMLINMGIKTPIDDLNFFLLNKHIPKEEISGYMDLFANHDVGLLSEAGVPAVADPGSEIVALAHKNNIEVVPLVGPSSILMGLMASGMNGQNFAFVGYLPVKRPERIKKLKQMEQRSLTENQTQIFIETPYRNNKMLEDIIFCCAPNTLLCIAANISTKHEFIKTMRIADWKRNIPDINKIPSIFILQRYPG